MPLRRDYLFLLCRPVRGGVFAFKVSVSLEDIKVFRLIGPVFRACLGALPGHGACPGGENTDRCPNQIIAQQILRLKLPVQLAKTLVPIGRFGERREKIGDDLLRTLSGGEREKAQHTPPGIGVGQLHDKLFDDVVCARWGERLIFFFLSLGGVPGSLTCCDTKPPFFYERITIIAIFPPLIPIFFPQDLFKLIDR